MSAWRLLDTPPMRAADNMALDDALLTARARNLAPNTIHFLQFSPRAVLVGYHQAVQEEIRREFCRARGIDINRRVTGGGAIFFDENQLGWEIICAKSFFDIRIPHQGLFQTLCRPVITALKILGLEADFRPRNDIEINGRKISGTGGTESEDAFLFQGTMLVDFDVETMLQALKIPVEKLKAKEIDSVKDRVTCLKWELGYTPPLDDIKAAIRRGFERELNIRLKPGELTPSEIRLFSEKRPDYASPGWIDKVDPGYPKRAAVDSAYKSEAGFIRFTLAVNPSRKRIRDVYITGDFLSFPSRSLYDLESALRGLPLDRNPLFRVTRDFFSSGRMFIPGMTAEDFFKPLDQALSKIEIARFGLALEHCNQISVANGSFAEIIAKRPSVLLLPYCAKRTGCDLRYEKACRMCGEAGCTIGPAWHLGLQRRMKIVSIVSFEDLWTELMRMKSRGVPAYIGCCCQPFFSKHVDDFIRSEIPGILLNIDNTTCYDLDQAKKAYAGQFESQTHVNLDLLDKVLAVAFRTTG